MSIEIPADLRPFVAQELKTGRYESEEALVGEALRMLRREREAAVAGIRAGLADAEADRMQPVGEAFSELRAELDIQDQ